MTYTVSSGTLNLTQLNSYLYVSNVSDCVKDDKAIIYQDLWGMGSFIRGGTAHLWGWSPPSPIAGYGPALMQTAFIV